MKVRISFTGTTRMLMHNGRLANPLDPIAKQMKAISGKRKKTDEDYEALARLEFEGGLYFDEDLGPYLPGVNIEKSLIEAARLARNGKQVERGLLVTDDLAPLAYRGPRTVDGLWADVNFRSMIGVKVGAARVMRTRPVFREWATEVEAEVDGRQLNLADLTAIANDAGALIGLGDFRPRHGRFTALVEEL